MPTVKHVASALVDIQALPVPAESLNIPFIGIVLVVLITVVLLGRYLWRRPKFVAWRRIHQLQRLRDTRQQLFLLHQALQLGLQVHQLRDARFAPSAQQEWLSFCHELLHVRYRDAVPASADVARLSQQAFSWLKRA